VTLTIITSCKNSEYPPFHFSSTPNFDIWFQESKLQLLHKYKFPHIRPIQKLQDIKFCEHFLVPKKDSSKYNAVKEGKLFSVCAVRAHNGNRGMLTLILNLCTIWW
jgi:hypothetical protein